MKMTNIMMALRSHSLAMLQTTEINKQNMDIRDAKTKEISWKREVALFTAYHEQTQNRWDKDKDTHICDITSVRLRASWFESRTSRHSPPTRRRSPRPSCPSCAGKRTPPTRQPRRPRPPRLRRWRSIQTTLPRLPACPSRQWHLSYRWLAHRNQNCSRTPAAACGRSRCCSSRCSPKVPE